MIRHLHPKNTVSHPTFSLIFRILIIAAGLGVPAVAQSQKNTMSRNARVDSIFAQWDRSDSPGCALGIYRDQRIIYARGYGMADLERRVPITPHTVFDIGSMGKQFTAASVVLLAQQGKLSLDDDVRRHMPELRDYGSPITLRHLLHHTSGIRDYNGLLGLAGNLHDDVTTDEEALALIVRQKELNFKPGTQHLYSNSGYFLLSPIVQRTSGKSLRDFAREQIFQPLGMTRTHYLGSYDDIVPDRALGYSPRKEGGLRTNMPRWLQLGDGGVWTTVEDLLLWDRNFYDPKVGGRAMIETLQTPGRLANGSPLTYALGLSVDSYRGQRTISHSGSWGGYRADLLRFPDQRLAVATLCNFSETDPSRLSKRVADIYLGRVLRPEAAANVAGAVSVELSEVPIASAILDSLSGTFRHSSLPEMRTVADNGKLYLAVEQDRFELRHLGSQRFIVLGAPAKATVVFNAAGAMPASSFRFQIEGQNPVLLSRVEVLALSAAALQKYEGTFFSDELQATYQIATSDGRLTITERGMPAWPFQSGLHDEFTSGTTTLRFTRDVNGEITGFFLDQSRARNLRFDKVRPNEPKDVP